MVFLFLLRSSLFFFFNDTPTTEIYTLSLHDALPILSSPSVAPPPPLRVTCPIAAAIRSDEHTSELQSRRDLVCRLLLDKKKKEGTSAVKLQVVMTGVRRMCKQARS